MGNAIVFGKTILTLLNNVEDQHGIETCLGLDGLACSRQGYYLFYVGYKAAFPVADSISYEVSASPFLDDKGQEIPTISVFSSILVYSRQLPLPVSFTEEIRESQPRVSHLPVISRTDEPLSLDITSLPGRGTLHHLIEAPLTLVNQIDSVQGHPPLSSFENGGCYDIQARLQYCQSGAFRY